MSASASASSSSSSSADLDPTPLAKKYDWQKYDWRDPSTCPCGSSYHQQAQTLQQQGLLLNGHLKLIHVGKYSLSKVIEPVSGPEYMETQQKNQKNHKSPPLDEIVITSTKFQLRFSYPLRERVVFPFISSTGFTRRQIIQLVAHKYAELYAEEDRTRGHAQVDGAPYGFAQDGTEQTGRYGIMGHPLSDLCLYNLTRPFQPMGPYDRDDDDDCEQCQTFPDDHPKLVYDMCVE